MTSIEKREAAKDLTDADRDPVMTGLDDLATTVEENARDGRLLIRRIDRLRAARANGRSWRAILAQQSNPGVLELVGRMFNRLGESSAGVRRPLAGALRREGLSIPTVAKMFGVSHQRVSTVLRPDRE